MIYSGKIKSEVATNSWLSPANFFNQNIAVQNQH